MTEETLRLKGELSEELSSNRELKRWLTGPRGRCPTLYYADKKKRNLQPRKPTREFIG